MAGWVYALPADAVHEHGELRRFLQDACELTPEKAKGEYRSSRHSGTPTRPATHRNRGKIMRYTVVQVCAVCAFPLCAGALAFKAKSLSQDVATRGFQMLSHW